MTKMTCRNPFPNDAYQGMHSLFTMALLLLDTIDPPDEEAKSVLLRVLFSFLDQEPWKELFQCRELHLIQRNLVWNVDDCCLLRSLASFSSFITITIIC